MNEFVPQMTTSVDASEYWVAPDAGGPATNFADIDSIWKLIESTFLLGLAGLLGYSGVRMVTMLLSRYAGSLGITVAQLVMRNNWNIAAVATAIAAWPFYKSSGRNPWPEDSSRKIKKK